MPFQGWGGVFASLLWPAPNAQIATSGEIATTRQEAEGLEIADRQEVGLQCVHARDAIYAVALLQRKRHIIN